MKNPRNFSSVTRACPLLLLAAAILLAGSSSVSQAAPKDKELPANLNLVPRDASAFVHVQAADLWNSDWLSELRSYVIKAGPAALKTFEGKNVVPPSSIDQLTMIMLTPQAFQSPFPHEVVPEGHSALIAITTKTPYDKLQLIQSLGLREKVYRKSLYWFYEELWSGVLLIDDRTFLVGAEDSILQYLDMMKKNQTDGPLQAALEEAARKHHVTIGLNGIVMPREQLPPQFQALAEMRCGVASLDLGKELQLECRVDFAKEEKTKEGAKAVQALIELGRSGLDKGIKELEKQLKGENENDREEGVVPEMMKGFGCLIGLGFLRDADGVLKDTKLQQDKSSLRLAIKYPRPKSADLSLVTLGSLSLIGTSSRTTFQRVGAILGGGARLEDPNEQHLKQLADAFNRYHEAKGTYPPTTVCDKDGRPLFSWRVALLPYMGDEADALHKEFKLDEPWDSLHNKKLIMRMPRSFKAPNAWKTGKTSDLVFAGAGAAFEGKKGIDKKDIRAEAILLVLAGDTRSVWWTKPADLAYVADKPLPKLFGKWDHEIHVLLGDGSVKLLTKDTDEKTIKEMISRKKQ